MAFAHTPSPTPGTPARGEHHTDYPMAMGVLTTIFFMLIVGGAVIPRLQGMLADNIGLQHAFFLPLLCYLYIVFYGLSGSKIRSTPSTGDSASERA